MARKRGDCRCAPNPTHHTLLNQLYGRSPPSFFFLVCLLWPLFEAITSTPDYSLCIHNPRDHIASPTRLQSRDTTAHYYARPFFLSSSSLLLLFSLSSPLLFSLSLSLSLSPPLPVLCREHTNNRLDGAPGARRGLGLTEQI